MGKRLSNILNFSEREIKEENKQQELSKNKYYNQALKNRYTPKRTYQGRIIPKN
jgi:hypothetical protein